MNYRRFPSGPLQTNTYLVWGSSGEGFIVDPAGGADAILSFAAERGVAVRSVLLTHGHPDHVGGLPELLERVEAGVGIGAGDAGMLRSPDQETTRWLGFDFRGISSFTELADGDSIEIGDMEIAVIGTPGHTPGGVCYLVSKEEGEPGLLLSGDTLFAGSVGRTDLPRGDGEELARSLERLATLPDSLPVLPGHGPETTIGAERVRNPFWPGRRA